MKPALGLGVLLVAVAPAAWAAPAGDDGWSALDRPLSLPRLERGAACPVSDVDRRVDWSRSGIAEGIGRGRCIPSWERATAVATRGRAEWGDTWGGTKVLWFVNQRYRGNVLIRGGRLDGWQRLRFDDGAIPSDELRIAAGPSPARWRDQPAGSRGRPSYIRVRAGGCYAAQIDGTTFSRTVFFRVRFGR